MAASSMKDIKLRIKSVESTMQITKAMELVASSKPVSYTHLDVYKRQTLWRARPRPGRGAGAAGAGAKRCGRRHCHGARAVYGLSLIHI